jgi:transcriptional regulator with XRE-family HTH domain
MTERTPDRNDLATFLRQRRARVRPEDVGLPCGRRRRTPGLRREEVAALAGVGVTWYTWFEQGRAIGVSSAFLDRLADALRLSRAERRHLFVLGGHRPPELVDPPTALSPSLQRMLDALIATPAYIKGPRWDILGWNRAAGRAFCDYGALPPGERNMLYQVFANDTLRCSMTDWENDPARMVAKFRVSYARNAGDPSFAALVDDLCAKSARFAELWSRHDVMECGEGMKRMTIADVGVVTFEYTALQVDGPIGTHAVVFVPMPGDGATPAFLRWISAEEHVAAA